MSFPGSDQDAQGTDGQLQYKWKRRFAAIPDGIGGYVLTFVAPGQPPSWQPSSGGGGGGSLTPASSYHKVAGNGDNAAVIKNTPGQVVEWCIFNNSADNQPLYVKLYDKATTPNPAVDVPLRTIGVQAGTNVTGPNYDGGINFPTGIAILITRQMIDTDDTGVAAQDCVVDIGYL